MDFEKNEIKGCEFVKKKGMACFLILLFLFSLTACQQGNHSSQSKQKAPQSEKKKGKSKSTPSAKSNKSKQTKSKKPQFIYPLTGKIADSKVTNRPIGVMVENSLPARPQSGLDKADIVYEALAEGAITRFLAIFQSHKPSIIGPVRSARPYFLRLNQGFGAIYVCHGWSIQAKHMIQSNKNIDNLNGLFYDGTLFHRKSFRQAPHNSYITYNNIIKGAKQLNFKLKANTKPLPFLTKTQMKNLAGNKANKVKIDYYHRYSVSFDYQADKGTYLRYSDGVKSVDLDTKTPITVSNVMIIEVPTKFIDSYPRRGMNLQAGGNALLMQKGHVQHVKWRNVNGRILPEKNGKIIGFVPGKTWVNLIPANPGISGAVNVMGGTNHAN